MFRKTHIEDLNRISIEEFKEITKIPIVIILDNIRSAHNTGSVFRTSDAFKIEKIFLCGITATPPNKEIHKSALGATDSVDWEYVNDCLELASRLEKEGFQLIAVEQTENSTLLTDFQPEKDKKYALVFGNEVNGVQQELIDSCTKVIEIPQFGTKHSLNVSVSAGICLWEFFKKMNS